MNPAIRVLALAVGAFFSAWASYRMHILGEGIELSLMKLSTVLLPMKEGLPISIVYCLILFWEG